MKRIILLLVFAASTRSSAQELDAEIKGNVKLATKHDRIMVDLHYKLITLDDTATRVQFFLSRAARLKSIKGTDVSSFYVDTSTHPAPSIVIMLKEKRKTHYPGFYFEYSLPYDTSKYDSYGFIELGLDWFWFPVHPKIGEWDMRFELLVSTDEDALNLHSNGTVTRKKKNTYRVSSIYTDYDINLFFFKGSKQYMGGNEVTIVGDTNNPKLKDSIAQETLAHLNFYKKIFGETVSKVTAVFRPQFNDPNAFGYSRKGYFVLQEMKSLAAVRLYIAHEIAHFWFIHGERTENAWLTESFAEFSAMLATKHFYGDSVYQNIIRDKYRRLDRFKKDGKTIPAVYKNGSKNKTMLTQVALYHKGPLILNQLMELIGEEKIIYLMRTAFEKKIRTSDDFIDLVGVACGENIKRTARELIIEF